MVLSASPHGCHRSFYEAPLEASRQTRVISGNPRQGGCGEQDKSRKGVARVTHGKGDFRGWEEDGAAKDGCERKRMGRWRRGQEESPST
ncbi:unnamed protein product [Lasius platythorax]|uniref:Uncharacterized protein n=1 Tax=Lasius platythorax TaxID=488582 RepID=A0AAV2N823_9HYME